MTKKKLGKLKYGDGGTVKPASKPKLKVQPLVVDNPNHPRLKAYNDSLKLYLDNPVPKGVKKVPCIRSDSEYANVLTGKTKEGYDIVEKQKVKKAKIEPEGFYVAPMTKAMAKQFSKDSNEFEDIGEVQYPYYKKPVQPIIYEPKPVVRTPINTVRVNQEYANLDRTIPIPRELPKTAGTYRISHNGKTDVYNSLEDYNAARKGLEAEGYFFGQSTKRDDGEDATVTAKYENGGEVMGKKSIKRINAPKYGWGGMVGTVAGGALGLGAAALTGGAAAPLIGVGASMGGSIGGSIDTMIDEADRQKEMEKMKQSQPQYVSPNMPYGYVMEHGGTVPKETINVEKNELEVKGGTVIRDFRNKPPHPKDGSLDPEGNVKAGVGNIIIPADKREDYIKGDRIKRNTIEANLRTKSPEVKYSGGGGVNPKFEEKLQYNYVEPVINQGDKITPIVYGEHSQYIDPITSKLYADGQRSANPYASGVAGSTTPITQPGKGNTNYASYLPLVDNVGNAIMTAFTPKPPKPILNDPVSLNKTVNIQPQLNDIERNRGSVMNAMASRTGSPSSLRANAANLFSKSQDMRNELYANKFNVENQLANQEILTNAEINRGNTAMKNDFENKKVLRKAGMMDDYSKNLNNLATDFYVKDRDKALVERDINVAKIMAKATPDAGQYLYDVESFADNYTEEELNKKLTSAKGYERRQIEGALLMKKSKKGNK